MTRRAVVLGAGGPAAIAWEVGVVAGLQDAGADLRDADLFVGTSAGSVVATQITSGLSIEEMFGQQIEPDRQVAPPVDFKELRAGIARAKAGGGSVSEMLRRVGAWASAARTVSEAQRREMIAARLLVRVWPERALRVAAVDVESGERYVFDRSSGVDLIDAVAASCAVPGVWPPITIKGRRYMDGGTYATENVDLAIGCDHVLVLALTPRTPAMAATSLDPGLKALNDSGARVEVVHPDEATEAAFALVGGNLLDPSVRESAARAGRMQGRNIATRLV
ncbi:MAG: patatin-like phospholipase family protein [Alphaproteobacteria bacterium]|nr:patatin-like phospholipase family protein [Alphaproteobacteria bacterium]MDE2630366.1 patatin-like phospholipase family protein [Alphaproteobacteria bacterium]